MLHISEFTYNIFFETIILLFYQGDGIFQWNKSIRGMLIIVKNTYSSVDLWRTSRFERNRLL